MNEEKTYVEDIDRSIYDIKDKEEVRVSRLQQRPDCQKSSVSRFLPRKERSGVDARYSACSRLQIYQITCDVPDWGSVHLKGSIWIISTPMSARIRV